ncbi:MAG: glycosyltransferase family 1 protein [Bacteroidales bacterium]|nr:glycosyltransferase family 1 protein [Bacteroidales bacterium]
MGTIKKLITSRRYNTWPSWDVVFEWEDVFREVFDWEFSFEPSINKRAKRIPVAFLTRLLHTSEPAFLFQMSPDKTGGYNKPNIIPCLVDFFLDEKKLPRFYRTNSRHPFLLVSSLEVIDYLEAHQCPVPLYHFPLSISDKYAFSSDSLKEKKYDLVQVGRTNPVMMGYLRQYAGSHPDFYYVYREQKGDVFNYYTSRGEYLGDISTREQYMSLLRQSRVGLYATPGMDTDRTNGFNPVTPRFLEMVVSGCHVLARYPATSETAFFELSKFSPSIDSYELFEARMDQALSREVDAAFYTSYLAKHYTSTRCALLKDLLKQYTFDADRNYWRRNIGA